MRFVDFARLHGVLIEHPRPDGRIHRCGTETHPRSTNGAYAWDGERGWVMAWDMGGELRWYSDPSAKPWTEQDKREWMKRRDDERKEQARRHQEAAQRAAELLLRCRPSDHGYLRLKGFPEARGLVLDEYRYRANVDGKWSEAAANNVLVVPMRSVQANRVVGAQLIWWTGQEWVKKMLPGTRAKQAVLRIGPPRARETVLCEGYATGLSILAAIEQMRMDAAVLVAFSANNLEEVASLVPGLRMVFADNDASGAGEAAARKTGLAYCMSPVVGEDANDLHQRAGIVAVCALITQARRDALSRRSAA